MNAYYLSSLLLLFLVCSSCTVELRVPPATAEQQALPALAILPAHRVLLSEAEKAAAVINQWCVSTSRIVTTANPTPIVVRDEKAKALRNLTDAAQSFGIGDSCQVGAGWWQGIGMLPEPMQNKVLVKYWNPAPRPYYFSCASETLFTVDLDDFFSQCAATGTIPVKKNNEKERRQQEKQLIESTLNGLSK